MASVYLRLEVEDDFSITDLAGSIPLLDNKIKSMSGIKDPEQALAIMTKERNVYCQEAHTLRGKIDWLRREAKIVDEQVSSLRAQTIQFLEVLDG